MYKEVKNMYIVVYVMLGTTIYIDADTSYVCNFERWSVKNVLENICWVGLV